MAEGRFSLFRQCIKAFCFYFVTFFQKALKGCEVGNLTLHFAYPNIKAAQQTAEVNLQLYISVVWPQTQGGSHDVVLSLLGNMIAAKKTCFPKKLRGQVATPKNMKQCFRFFLAKNTTIIIFDCYLVQEQICWQPRMKELKLKKKGKLSASSAQSH